MRDDKMLAFRGIMFCGVDVGLEQRCRTAIRIVVYGLSFRREDPSLPHL